MTCSSTMRQIPSGEHQYACDELCDVLKFNFRRAERDDLYPVTRLAVEIDPRSGLVTVPDIVVLNTKPIGRVFKPDQVVLVAEVWTAEDSSDERARKFDLYAQAEIRYLWTADLDEPAVYAHEFLGNNWYRLRDTLRDREIDRIEAAPVPVSIQPAQLVRRARV